MNKVEMIQFMLVQLKQTPKNHDELVEVFANYKTMLLALDASNVTYHSDLRRLREELPDMERLITKKHDPILKGRLVDALMAFRKKVEEHETAEGDQPVKEETPASEEKRVRNMPNLGMS